MFSMIYVNILYSILIDKRYNILNYIKYNIKIY